MPPANRWFDRSFEFEGPAELYPVFMERLRGLPPRVEEKVATLSRDRLVARHEGTWSIQENVGHLLDLEPLWLGRLEDFLAGAPTLRPADLDNRRTHEAGHNDAEIGRLLSALRSARERFVARLDALPPGDFARVSRHPRLGTPMRLCDLLEFTAEHDDHHLARMTLLGRRT